MNLKLFFPSAAVLRFLTKKYHQQGTQTIRLFVLTP